jgi:hypothetical protein
MRAGSPDLVLDRLAEAPRCAALLDIWKGSRDGDRTVPTRSGLDPIVLARAGLLPYVWILERDAGEALRYRLIGEGIRRHFAAAIRGRYLHEVYGPEMLAMVASRSVRVMASREVLFTSGIVYRDRAPIYYARRILMPLGDEDGAVRFLIGTVDQSTMGDDFDATGNPWYTNDFVAFVKADHF